MTTLLPVLSPSSILLPCLSHCTHFKSVVIKNVCTFLKLHNLKLYRLGCVCTVHVNGEYLAIFGILNPMLLRVNWSTGAKGLMKDKSDCGVGIVTGSQTGHSEVQVLVAIRDFSSF
jgi:hypothetical protein